ncbi:unnamed protein product, partial [Discosporangium mesarthrocarpum]
MPRIWAAHGAGRDQDDDPSRFLGNQHQEDGKLANPFSGRQLTRTPPKSEGPKISGGKSAAGEANALNPSADVGNVALRPTTKHNSFTGSGKRNALPNQRPVGPSAGRGSSRCLEVSAKMIDYKFPNRMDQGQHGTVDLAPMAPSTPTGSTATVVNELGAFARTPKIRRTP